ncbi:MAG TPA: hypothetical protein VIK12_01200, partial [Pengzhenrongella sp.]
HRVTGWICDDAVSFAQGIIELFEDDDLWRAVSEAGRAHVERKLGSDVFEGSLRALFESTTSSGIDD